MIMILNEDIDILKEFTLKSVIKAIGLERAFNSIMSKNINIVRDSVNVEYGQKAFNQWLKENMHKIRQSEYAVINKNMEAFKDKKAIANAIRQVLSKLDN